MMFVRHGIVVLFALAFGVSDAAAESIVGADKRETSWENVANDSAAPRLEESIPEQPMDLIVSDTPRRTIGAGSAGATAGCRVVRVDYELDS